MTTGNLYFDMFIGVIFGVLFHVFVMKLPALKRRAKAANVPFNVNDYFRDDWIALAASLITGAIGIFVFDELTGAYPSVVKYAKFFFVFVGYTGSSLLQGILSKTEAKIQAVVDLKTDKADNI